MSAAYSSLGRTKVLYATSFVLLGHLRKPRVLTPLRSLRVRNEVELVPLACEDAPRCKSQILAKETKCLSCFGRDF